MKTAYKVLLGAVALAAAGYATVRLLSGTRSEPYVPDAPDPDDVVVADVTVVEEVVVVTDVDLAPADAAEVVEVNLDEDCPRAAWMRAGVVAENRPGGTGQALEEVAMYESLHAASQARMERTGPEPEADLLEKALQRAIEEQQFQFQPAKSGTPEPLTGDALKEVVLKDFRETVIRLSAGKLFTKKDVRVEVTVDEQGGQTLALTQYNAQGGPCGHVYLSWVSGFSYRTDGCFTRTRGSDLERVVDLLLIFEKAIDDEDDVAAAAT